MANKTKHAKRSSRKNRKGVDFTPFYRKAAIKTARKAVKEDK